LGQFRGLVSSICAETGLLFCRFVPVSGVSQDPGITTTVFIAESWLNDTYSGGMLVSLSEYNVNRVDRGSRGGGVCALVSTSLCSYIVPVPARFLEVEVVLF
jgi:hypothetical protein